MKTRSATCKTGITKSSSTELAVSLTNYQSNESIFFLKRDCLRKRLARFSAPRIDLSKENPHLSIGIFLQNVHAIGGRFPALWEVAYTRSLDAFFHRTRQQFKTSQIWRDHQL